MTPCMGRRSYRSGARRGRWSRIAMAALPLIAIAFILLPQSATSRVREWTGPIFAPFQDATQGWTLDIADHVRGPSGDGSPAATLAERVTVYENALAEATALLSEKDRVISDLAHLRQGLDGLPCRLTPARLILPEVPGGHAAGRLREGADKGIAKGGAVIVRRLSCGAREAIQRGEPVLVAAGLVGIVDDVGPLTSTVRFTTDPRTSIMVQVITRRGGQWRAGPEGVARGTDDGSAITVQGIPRGADIQAGDFLVTSPSPESPLPPYLVVGRVLRSELKAAGLFHNVVAEPRVSPADAREVYVLSPEAPATPHR